MKLRAEVLPGVVSRLGQENSYIHGLHIDPYMVNAPMIFQGDKQVANQEYVDSEMRRVQVSTEQRLGTMEESIIEGDTKTLQDSKTYTDSEIAKIPSGGTGGVSQDYVDQLHATQATEMKAADDAWLVKAKAYSDSKVSGVAQSYVDDHDLVTLKDSKKYTDDAIKAMSGPVTHAVVFSSLNMKRFKLVLEGNKGYPVGELTWAYSEPKKHIDFGFGVHGGGRMQVLRVIAGAAEYLTVTGQAGPVWQTTPIQEGVPEKYLVECGGWSFEIDLWTFGTNLDECYIKVQKHNLQH